LKIIRKSQLKYPQNLQVDAYLLFTCIRDYLQLSQIAGSPCLKEHRLPAIVANYLRLSNEILFPHNPKVGWFRDFIAKTDLPQITIHSLRHTNITLLLAAGVPLRTVSYRAGYAQTSTTKNIYAHAVRTADEIASEALDDILTP
jgi:integrase